MMNWEGFVRSQSRSVSRSCPGFLGQRLRDIIDISVRIVGNSAKI
jgi:hypothetical protein